LVFSSQDTSHIPIILKGQTWYDVSTETGYEALYRHLTDQPRVLKPTIGELKPMPPLRAKQDEALPEENKSGSDEETQKVHLRSEPIGGSFKTDTSKFQLLHISDLHVKEGEEFDRSVVLDPLIDRVAEDIDNGFQPEVIVVTGDIAYSGKETQYQSVKKFFDVLLKKMNLSDDRLFIVPGNHDVDRKRYRKSDVLTYENMAALNEEFDSRYYREDLLKGMEAYFTFIESSYPHLLSIEERLVPFVHTLKSRCGKHMGIVGLNSAWMCRKSPDEREIAIGEYQMIKAMNELKTNGQVDSVIIVFHHPLSWLWPVDRMICRQYLNNSVILCGHLHDAEEIHIQSLDSRYYQFQAGAAYEGSEFPNRFQFVTFDWDKQEIRLDFRKFDKDRRRWALEGEKGRDGTASFSMMGIGKKEKSQAPVGIPEIPESYYKWLLDRCGDMDTEKLCGKSEVIRVSLPEVFIPLYTHIMEVTSKERLMPGEKWLGEKKVSIEEVIGQKDSLLIEGHLGSGKTTLMKHLAYSLVKKAGPEGLDNFLPVMIFLRELKGFSSQGHSWEAILSYYFDRIANVLDLAVVNNFCRVNKVLFLLDGLDEMDSDERELLVNTFADFRHKHRVNKVVLTGRPHGLEGAAMKRFGEDHIKILSLDMDQIQDFIRKWFSHVYSSTSQVGRKNAESMISEVKSHPAIDKLIDNPLMLTAICILYHDGKELPGQRAELYKKFVDNMLYRRFPDDNERVHEFLMALAFKMHSERVKGVDRVWAVDVLSQTYQKEAGEKEKEHRKRIEDQFDYIEPRCGLIRLEQGEYRFWHLTFQEFLTCRYIVDNRKDYGKAISGYWDQDWYKEVIELFIGYLSIENKKWANDIVKSVLDAGDKTLLKRRLLACKSMIDIHKDRRYPAVLTKTKEILLEIIGSNAPAKARAEAGETLGWLGDPRELEMFIPVNGSQYSLSAGVD
jgi:predicted MPP superfamily phosphohydrolase/energy-coupling factor transporter ATP-binding protein EcfA2